jgi:hypothetical protein
LAGSSEGRDYQERGPEVVKVKAWAGVDAGKEFHWVHVLDASGEKAALAEGRKRGGILLGAHRRGSLAEETVWAVDQPGGGAALLLALLWERNQKGVLYFPGLSVDRVRDTYRGESKTDARDAHVIADLAWMRSELDELKPGEQEITELQLLLARRRDLTTDQSRTITRLREALLSLFQAPERTLDLNSKVPIFSSPTTRPPAKLRRAGLRRVVAYLRNRAVKGSANVAHKALGPAGSESVTLPAQDVASRIVAELAEEILAFKESIARIDEDLGRRFFARPEARILTSLPDMGLFLGAEFLEGVMNFSSGTVACGHGYSKSVPKRCVRRRVGVRGSVPCAPPRVCPTTFLRGKPSTSKRSDG